MAGDESSLSRKYRGATVADLDPPPALSCHPGDTISSVLLQAFEREYTHLTVTSTTTRSLLGYVHIPRLRTLISSGSVQETDAVEKAMWRFNRKRGTYRVITMDTPLEELEVFLAKEDFAVVTDPERRFVLGVATGSDLEEFVRRRPQFTEETVQPREK